MKEPTRHHAVLAGVTVALAALAWAAASVRAGADAPPPGGVTPPATPGADTAISAVIEANGGKVPATGEQLTKALAKLGKFNQLPVPFSAVRLHSNLNTPRVVLAPEYNGLSRADVTDPNFDGRLYLAANMARHPLGGDPRVISVEFISWTTTRRQFDFGVIDDMGNDREPQLQVLDGGKCFACHKNRGPILGARPWSNSTHDDILRFALASSLLMRGEGLPQSGPFALPQSIGGSVLRNQIDGMTLAIPAAPEVDASVRNGASLRTNRDAFRLMTRTPAGRKALVILLGAITEPGALDANDRKVGREVDIAFDPSFLKFKADWVELQKATRPNALLDVDPTELVTASGVRPVPRTPVQARPTVVFVQVPGLRNGNGSLWNGPASRAVTLKPTREQIAAAKAQKAIDDFTATLVELKRYNEVRLIGSHGLTSKNQPSNLRAFTKPPVPSPKRPSEVVNSLMLAVTIGLTDGDRRFLNRALEDNARRVNDRKVTPATLARGVFEGPAFADVLAGGPLPDRDEFKDRFVAGLDGLLKNKYALPVGFAPDRREYASGPRHDPTAAEEQEVALVPTTACMRCHEVSNSGKAPRFDPIPPLAFDPFDRAGREAWVKGADPKKKKEVLARLQERLVTDADMPPEDAPEHGQFRLKDPAAFDDVKQFLVAHLGK